LSPEFSLSAGLHISGSNGLITELGSQLAVSHQALGDS
jgi:hypothetical protein